MDRNQKKQLLPIIKAFSEGKLIQSRCIKGDKSLWYDDEDPSFDDDFEYRIKPEQKFRPFKDAEERWAEMQKHQPFGWVKVGESILRLITLVDVNRIQIGNQDLDWTYALVFKKFIFMDGQPFGVKEEE